LRGIEKIDAKLERLLDQRYGVAHRLRIIAHAEPARPTATEAGNANFQSRTSESGIFHLFLKFRSFETSGTLFRRLKPLEVFFISFWFQLKNCRSPFATAQSLP
jgi:hypothetical protein